MSILLRGSKLVPVSFLNRAAQSMSAGAAGGFTALLGNGIPFCNPFSGVIFMVAVG
jgi:hypothetical protein